MSLKKKLSPLYIEEPDRLNMTIDIFEYLNSLNQISICSILALNMQYPKLFSLIYHILIEFLLNFLFDQDNLAPTQYHRSDHGRQSGL